jgi:hypothetical protein
LQALGEGKITPEEMPVPPDTRKDHIRYAPGFGGGPSADRVLPYTVEALAKFLGEVQPNNAPRESFRAAFDALETSKSFVIYRAVVIVEQHISPARKEHTP